MKRSTHRPRILYIEDDENLGFLTQENLEMNGFEVNRCRDGQEGLVAFQFGEYDLCIIDIMLPKKDGFEVAETIRTMNDRIPIVFLTARSMKEDKIRGFRLGCDDYQTKPFSAEELVLRIQAILRRTRSDMNQPEDAGRFLIGDYEFTDETRILKIRDQQIKLTYKESELLRLLVINRNKIIDKKEILETIWQDDSYYNARSLDVYISRLRKYLQDDARIHIMTLHGKGYKLTANLD